MQIRTRMHMLGSAVVLIVHLLFGSCHDGYEGCRSKNLKHSDRQLIENEHNSRRSRLSKGLEHSASGKLPKAVDIYKMFYDCQLEKIAQEYADTCDFKDQANKHLLLGQNRYTSSATNESNMRIVKSATQLWWSEIANYSIPAGQPPKHNRDYGHFLQMAWSTTVSVGCGISSGCERTLFICLYSPPFDYGRGMVYTTGDNSCECTTYMNSKCDHSEQLCIAGSPCAMFGYSSRDKARNLPALIYLFAVTPLQMTKNIGSTVRVYNRNEGDEGKGHSDGREYKKSDDSGQFKRCPSTELTDSHRQLILTEHNSRRSSLARGIQRTANGFAPKASQLYKLVYDCELEKLSQVSAHTCKYVASGYYNDFEENVYTFGRNQLTKEQSIKNAASVWWDEITNVTRQAGKPLIHDISKTFTQMASDRNVKIGCGIEPSCFIPVVICKYLPGDNSGKRKLYAIGSPCKRDADCTRYNGSYCSVKEGLCNLPLPRRPRHNGADVYLHGWLSLFNGEMTKEELLISIAYFRIVSLLLTVV